MELLVESPAGLTPMQVRIQHRLSTRLHARAIDERLAHGAPPEGNILLAVRAHELALPQMRRKLIDGIDRAVAAVRRADGNPFTVFDRRRVAGSLPELQALRARLDSGQPPAQGLAAARLLLTDGRSPMYNAHAARSLRSELQALLRAFDGG